MYILNLAFYLLIGSMQASNISNKTSPLDLLCFALSHPKVRRTCRNNADSYCLLNNLQIYNTKIGNFTNICTTDGVIDVNINLLMYLSNQTRAGHGNVSNINVWLATYVKNDAQTTVEWLVWHFLLGISHVLIYDNESTDNLIVALAPFVSAGLVNIIPFPGLAVQTEAFTDALTRARAANVTWLATIDVDEYIAPYVDGNIPHFLQRYSHLGNVGGVRLNWQYVNSMGRLWRFDSGHLLNQTILDRSEFHTGTSDAHIKTIVFVNRTIEFIDPHYAIHRNYTFAINPDRLNKGHYHFTKPPQMGTAVILHFHIRTLEEWIVKR